MSAPRRSELSGARQALRPARKTRRLLFDDLNNRSCGTEVGVPSFSSSWMSEKARNFRKASP